MLRVVLIVLLLTLLSCGTKDNLDYQLIITNASVFNPKTLQIEEGQSVFIKDGIIQKILKTENAHNRFKNVLDAQHKLLTPSFVDVHNHLNFIFGDTTVITDSSKYEAARRKMTEQYLPYGVTVVRSAGGRKEHIPMMKSWMAPSSQYVDYYPTGGALVSLNTQFYNHTFVPNVAQVDSAVRAYSANGFKHIKVYSLIGKEQLKTAIETANELNMGVVGHIENAMISIDTAITAGLHNFEHVKTLFLDVIRYYESTNGIITNLPPDDNDNWRFREYEVFNYLGDNDPKLNSLVERLKENRASVTPTLTLYAHPLGLTESSLNLELHKEDRFDWLPEKLERARKGYSVLEALTYKLYKNGVRLNTGSDTYEPGKTILSEMVLLNRAGIPMMEVLKIATLNSAESMNMDEWYGSLEVGKKADMILFEKNPLENPLYLLSTKMVFKDGVLWSPTGENP
ncbi:amidohydrolase family protein [Muricauda sp. CAU 1633]|uniref:amidohydrolase family protein n=1 Tax=Allomuricauda sp. CAU 1633 TaxID=2816036 RepID=UPI001A8D62AD|nr:amidohydrolase family protein [Muricauda sp. CAU 1633]MBO0323629.1 amidohydrolase family protein [Muricauda sp. CAU 1633]